MRFVNPNATTKIQHESWDKDEVVNVYSHMSFEQQSAIQAAGMTVRIDREGAIDAKAEIAAMRQESLVQMIHSWTFKKELDNGTFVDVPVTPETISTLYAPDAQFIYNEIQKLNPGITKEQESSFLSKPNSGSKVVELRRTPHS